MSSSDDELDRDSRGRTAPSFIQGALGPRPHAMHWIFVRAAGELSDRELLDALGLTQYQRMTAGSARYSAMRSAGCWITETDQWLHLFEGNYRLFYCPEVWDGTRRLGARYDTLTCSIGDCDVTYNFEVFRGGAQARRLVVDCEPHSTDPRTRTKLIDVGTPLPVEFTFDPHDGEESIVMRVAASLGIEPATEDLNFRAYAPPADAPPLTYAPPWPGA